MTQLKGRLESGSDLTAPLLDGRYQLGAMVGRGGMGVVYRALDLRLNRIVAVKLLCDVPGADESRFRGEVEMLAQFVHPNLVRLLDAGDAAHHRFLVMDLVEGETLATRLEAGPLSGEESWSVGSGIASALAYVHGYGIVHRDVKPANVLLDGRRKAHLADFGIARLVDGDAGATELTLGTPAYLAPEQVRGRTVGPPADVYALGLVLIECLTGKRAFDGTASEATTARLSREPELPSSIPGDWRDLLQAMTRLLPDERIQASEVALRLGAVRSGITPEVREAAATQVLGGRAEVDAGIPTAPAIFAPPWPTPDPPKRSLRSWWRRFGDPAVTRRRTLGFGLASFVCASMLVLGLAGEFSGPAAAPTATSPPAHHTSAQGTNLSGSTSHPRRPSVTAATAHLIAVLDRDVGLKTVTAPAAQYLTGLLQPLLVAQGRSARPQEALVFNHFMTVFDAAVAARAITTHRAVTGLDAAIGQLALALDTVPNLRATSASVNRPATTASGGRPRARTGSGGNHLRGRGATQHGSAGKARNSA